MVGTLVYTTSVTITITTGVAAGMVVPALTVLGQLLWLKVKILIEMLQCLHWAEHSNPLKIMAGENPPSLMSI